MKFTNVSFVLSMFIMVLAMPAAADTVLNADFEASAVDLPIGTGGPTLGEPAFASSCSTSIVDTPMSTRCLAIIDNNDYTSGSVAFEFLQDAEPMTGILEMSMNVRFSELDSYIIMVREHGSPMEDFLGLRFNDDGGIYISDAAGFAGLLGSYEAGLTYDLILSYDMDAGTYDVMWDGAMILDNRAHGITDRGVGTLYLGLNSDVDFDGILYVDNLVVTASDITPTSTLNFGSLKSIYR